MASISSKYGTHAAVRVRDLTFVLGEEGESDTHLSGGEVGPEARGRSKRRSPVIYGHQHRIPASLAIVMNLLSS